VPDYRYVKSRALALCLALAPTLSAQSQVEYIGGTSGQLRTGSTGRVELTDDRYFAFYGNRDVDHIQLRIPYARMNLIEYGQQVDRRLALALVLSPVFLLSKARKHYLTVGFTDEAGAQQAIVFRVDKDSIRAALVALEARSGLKVRYQDHEARKAGN